MANCKHRYNFSECRSRRRQRHNLDQVRDNRSGREAGPVRLPVPPTTAQSSPYSPNSFSALPWAMRSLSAADTGICSKKARAAVIEA